MKLKIQPVYEDGELIGRGPRIEGWELISLNNKASQSFSFRSEAVDAAMQIAKFADESVIIEITK